MTYTVLQLLKRYQGNAPLINSMVKPDSEFFRTIACYLGNAADGSNGMDTIAHKTIYCDLPKKKISWTSISTVKSVATLIDRNQVDLVVCQFRRPMPIGVLAAMLSRRKPKVIGVMHGIVGGKVGPARKMLNYFVYRRLAKLVSVSQYDVEQILRLNIGLPKSKVVAIQNGLVCEPFLEPPKKSRAEILSPARDEKFLFGMVGRLAPKKNHASVVKAFAQIAADYPQAELLFAGEGPEKHTLEDLIEDLNLQGQVSLLGHRKDIPDLMKHLDAFLMPSLREGLPMALMEAMAAGVPVITSRSGGMSEVVSEPSLGMLVDPESVSELAAAMKTMLDMPAAELKEMGLRGRQRVLDRFTAARMADAYEKLYLRVLNDEKAHE